jgi:hypothetical protein
MCKTDTTRERRKTRAAGTPGSRPGFWENWSRKMLDSGPDGSYGKANELAP